MDVSHGVILHRQKNKKSCNKQGNTRLPIFPNKRITYKKKPRTKIIFPVFFSFQGESIHTIYCVFSGDWGYSPTSRFAKNPVRNFEQNRKNCTALPCFPIL